MLADYSKILEILQRCTSENVSQAEAELKELAMQDIQVMGCLQQALRDPTLEKYMHTIATSHINSIFTTNQSEYTQEFSLKYFTILLMDPNINMENKKEVSRSIMYCIELCDYEYLTKWKEFTLSSLIDENLYEVGLLLLTAFSCADIKHNLIEELDEKPFQFTMRILCQNFKHFEYYKKIGFVFEAWKIVIEYMIHFCPRLAANLFIEMANSEYLPKALTIAYLSYSSSKERHYFYINDQDYELTEKVNEMKKIALDVHQLLISETLKHTRNTLLYAYTGQQIEIFVNSLCFASMQKGFVEEYEMDHVLIEMLKIVRIFSVDEPEILSKSWKQLLHYIIFPFLSISGEELQHFETETSSFMELSEDCCEKQVMGNLKTESALFLEKLSDISEEIVQEDSSAIEEEKQNKKNKGQPLITKYIIRFAVASIKDQLQMQFIKKDEFLVEQEMPESVHALSLETSFLVLSIFSYCIEDFPKEIEEIKVILCSDQVKGLPPLERARIYTFLAYNHEEIFENSENYSTRHWIDFAFMEESHPTVAYCALDFITNSLYKVYDEKSINAIIRRISTNTSPNFWGLLKKMTTLFLLKFSEQTLISLIQQIYGRIEFEILKLSKQRVVIVINHLLQILRTICEKGEFIQSRPTVRQLLWSTSEIYRVSVENYFEDDVVKIINCFLLFASKEEIEHPQMHNFLNLFAKDFEKNTYEYTHYYIAFNCMLMKGSLDNTVLPIYFLMKKSLTFHLQQKEKKEATRKKLPIAHTLLLLQNIVAIHGSSLPIEEIQYMTSITEILYPKTVEKVINGEIKSKHIMFDRVLLARALNLQFLCHMYYPFPNLLQNLRKYHDLRIFYGYDVSVIFECLKHLIVKEENMLNISEILRILIRIIDSYIEMDTELKVNNINEKEKKILSANSLQENDGGIIEEQYESKEEKRRSELIIRLKKATDYEVILAFINTPFLKEERKVIGYNKAIKEVEEISKDFIILLNNLKKLNPALIESILNGFSESVIHKLDVITDRGSNNSLIVDWRGQDQNPKKCENNDEKESERKVYRILKSKKGPVDDEVEEYGIREFINGEESLRNEEEESCKNTLTKNKKNEKQINSKFQ